MRKTEEVGENDLLNALSKRIFNEAFQFSVCEQLTIDEVMENDFSTLTAQEIIDKIRDHIKQGPSNVNSLVFLKYLAYYPVSMCKREVSPLLKKIIGFHYNLGESNEHLKNKHSIDSISYDDLAEIFGRSKATISEYVNQIQVEWQTYLKEVAEAEAIKKQAERELIEEEKQLLRKTNEETKEQTNIEFNLAEDNV